LASPTKAGQLGVDRAAVEVFGGGVLRDLPVAQRRDPVGHRQRLVLVVGHQDRGGAGPAEDLLDVGADAGPQVRVERGERLVEQHHGRLDGQGPGQRDPLLLAAGQLMRVPLAQPAQAHRSSMSADRPARRSPADSPNPTLAATVRCGNRLPSCGTYPMRRRSGGT
jgi:hypothetical protein